MTDGRTFETHFIRLTQKSRPNNNCRQKRKSCKALLTDLNFPREFAHGFKIIFSTGKIHLAYYTDINN